MRDIYPRLLTRDYTSYTGMRRRWHRSRLRRWLLTYGHRILWCLGWWPDVRLTPQGRLVVEGYARSTPRWSTVIDGDPCVYCGGPATTVDHMVPKSAGGSGGLNLHPACIECNRTKRAYRLVAFLVERTLPPLTRKGRGVRQKQESKRQRMATSRQKRRKVQAWKLTYPMAAKLGPALGGRDWREKINA